MEIARLKKEGLSFRRIARLLGVGTSTAHLLLKNTALPVHKIAGGILSSWVGVTMGEATGDNLGRHFFISQGPRPKRQINGLTCLGNFNLIVAIRM